ELYRVKRVSGETNPGDLRAQCKPDRKGKVVDMKIPYDDGKTSFIRYNKTPEKPKNADRETDRGSRSDQGPQHKDTQGKQDSTHVGRGANTQLAAANPTPRPQGGGRGRGPRANQLAVNPYTGDIIGDPGEVKTRTAEFMQKMFGLHRWLLLNEIEEPLIEGIENRKLGSWITGTATLLFLLGVLTGIVIWF